MGVYPAAHPNVRGSDSEMLPVREVAMMGVMNSLTDKKDWHKKVFDEAIVEKWREEAMAIPDQNLMTAAAAPSSDWYRAGPVDVGTEPRPENTSTRVEGIMSKAAFDYCIQELQSKARYFEETALIPTLDASATVIKSDVFISDELQEALRQAFKTLQEDQADEPDWHPGSRDMVQDLVHPSMYPLIYGRSRALNDEVVGVTEAISHWAGKGEIVPKDTTPVPERARRTYNESEIPDSYWSSAYQWLPSNVGFREDGSVKFMSYINNLHPEKYPEIYNTVERLIDRALPAWDHCLLETRSFRTCGPGRRGSRFSIPENADDEETANWNPSDMSEVANVEVDLSQDRRFDWVEEEQERKWRLLRTPVLREPDPFVEINYDPSKVVDDLDTPLHSPPTQLKESAALMRGLREKFQTSGLQIIVKMASIELTPGKPEFPGGGWHIEGLLNERICATALYYLDSENITDSSLSFRMHTSSYQDDLQDRVGQDSYHWLECCYGTSLSHGSSCIQNYGSVETREGRFLAFPNVFQHRVSPFKLADPNKPGHRRFIALWLVDPHCRIISTANVPPQQQDWWAESVFGKSEDSQASAASRLPGEMVQLLREKGVALPSSGSTASLPPELLDIVRGGFDLPTLSLEEAKKHRLKLMEERTTHHGEAIRSWEQASYSFCEH
ncbi:hypothetical protein J7T55_008258 [Diaporthe amygdali]|uniref:uncharacterized protein n=1 Tax=Phomopsis amygdali TaxID=1214568 RepID=UPI0022FDF946|nr:uncharacterized protein J7T55_008258 [Diaporthe amygdali]KAJ0121097.1 hypothetical protein J7T55_008258 [Diaporthe amygdali]